MLHGPRNVLSRGHRREVTPLVRCTYTLRVLAVITCLAGVACMSDATSDRRPVRTTLDEVFATETVITLGEDQQDSISIPGIWKERRRGGFLLSDGHLPRIRSYDEDGRLEAAFGRFGRGPFEFQRIGSVTETPEGRVVVADGGQAGLTYLTSDLRPDTLVAFPGVPRRVESLGDDLLVRMNLLSEWTEDASRFFRQPLLLHRVKRQSVVWSAHTLPFVPIERPYWMSMIGFPFAVAGDSIYVASSLRYPMAILNAEGDSVGEIGAPSETFKPVPVFEPGALTPGQYSTGSSNVLAGYNTISRIDAVGSHLILTHGQYDSARFLRSLHSTVDIYDRHGGVKLYEDVPLPERSRILGGGRYLYMLLDTDFPPWRVAKLRFRDRATRRP